MKRVLEKVQVGGRRRAMVAGLGLLGAIGGCKTSPVIEGPDIKDWPVVPLTNSDLVPTNTDPGRRTRVVVLATEDSPSAGTVKLAEVATAALETMLGSGGVEIVERRLADRLDRELKLAEMRGSGSYGGPEVADFAIRVVMGTAGWGTSYRAASSNKNPLTGKTVNTPGGHVHTGNSNMSLRIYALPSLKLVEQFQLEGRVSSNLMPSAAGPAQGPDLMRSATAEGVKLKQNEVINEFSPKGYITERRSLNKVSIFRVQIGKDAGAKTGNTVEIFSMQKAGNALDEVNLGKGVMSDVVGRDGSWIRVDDEKVANRVKKFDYVKVKRGGGFLDSLPRMPSL